VADKLDNMSIGKRIKIIRGSLGQLEFAKEIGVKRNTVSGNENNNIIPSGTVLQEVFKW
jgi:transcriptional regulator with XRE-family HTH domain